MDNNNNNNNNNNIYKLYKSVFSNKCIAIIIFKYINIINKQLQLKVIKYKDATFNWMIKNNHYNLYYDQIKNGIQMDDSTYKERGTINNLKSFISKTTFTNYSNAEFILDQFYNLNKDILNKIEYNDSQVREGSFNILVFSITTNNELFFNIVFNSMLNGNQNELNVYFKNINGSTLVNLIDIALRFGNLDIIKRLHQHLGIDQFNQDTIFIEALNSDNRDSVVKYLLENNIKINFKPSSEYISNYDSKYYSNILKLNYGLFRELYNNQNTIPIKFDNQILDQLIEPMMVDLNSNGMDIHISYHYNRDQDYRNDQQFLNYFINCFKSILFTCSVVLGEKKFISMLKKLNYLLDYNTKLINIIINTDNDLFYQISSDENLKYIITKEDIIYNSNNNSNSSNNSNNNNSSSSSSSSSSNNIISKVLSKLSIYKQHQQLEQRDELERINFNNFDIKREVHRMFIFDYLKHIIKIQGSPLNILDKSIYITEFMCIYKEYNLLSQLSSVSIDSDYDKRRGYSNEYFNLDGKELSKITIKYLDGVLLKEMFNFSQRYDFHYSGASYYKPIQLFNPYTTPISQQIQFIGNSFQNISFISYFLPHFFNAHGNNLTTTQLEQIGNYIKFKCNSIKPIGLQKINSSIFNKNQYLCNYYISNFNEYFSNWDNNIDTTSTSTSTSTTT